MTQWGYVIRASADSSRHRCPWAIDAIGQQRPTGGVQVKEPVHHPLGVPDRDPGRFDPASSSPSPQLVPLAPLIEDRRVSIEA